MQLLGICPVPFPAAGLFSGLHNEGPAITGFQYTSAESHNPLNVRFGSKADIPRLPSECPLSGAKRT